MHDNRAVKQVCMNVLSCGEPELVLWKEEGEA